jgi:HEAT repeat protein
MVRHIRHLWQISAAVALLCALHGAPAAGPYAPDAVEELRNALKITVRDSANRDELQYRKDLLEKRVKALTLGDIRRALLLNEWRDEDSDEAVAAVDRPIKEALINRLVKGLRGVLTRGSTAAKLAAIAQVSEIGTTLKAIGGRRGLASELAPDLAKQTERGDPLLREAAAKALGNIIPDPKAATAALGSLLIDGTVGERRAAADGLAGLLRTLYRLTKGSKTTQGVQVIPDEVARTATAVVPAAAPGLGDPDLLVRKLCLEALQLAGNLLTDLVTNPRRQEFPPADRKVTKEEREEIAVYRKEVEDERRMVLPLARALNAEAGAVARALTDPVPEIRYLAALALEDMGYARLKLLRKAASVPAEQPPDKDDKEAKLRRGHRDPFRQVAATEAVAQEKLPVKPKELGGDDPFRSGLIVKGLPLLTARLFDPNVRVRLTALDALEPLGPDAAPAVTSLARSLLDPDRFVRWASARVLMKVGPYETDLTVPVLAKLLCDIDLDVRRAAEATLGSFGPSAAAAVPALAAAALSGDEEQRIDALHSLEAIGAKAHSAIPSMAAALADGDARVREAAAQTLGAFGPAAKAAIPALERAVFDKSDAVRKAASDALLSITAEE